MEERRKERNEKNKEMDIDETLEKLQNVIGYTFKDTALLKQALTHSSYANEMKINRRDDYERLEFLGDAVLELVSSEFLYLENKELPEGKLTKLRASLVCEQALAYCAREMKLEEYILLGKGEELTGGRNRDSIISDVCEAVIGALYLDGGMEVASSHIKKFILCDLKNRILFFDAKTILQEEIQRKGSTTIKYELIAEEGPEHDKTFTVQLVIGDKACATGSGHTKKAAEQQAAYEMLLAMKK